MTSKIHPTEGKAAERGFSSSNDRKSVWTVWKKSSMAFQGTDGFSVYDSKGRLAFRVDNYSRRNKYFSGELVLMDGAGRALLSLRPQILSMHDRWNGFKANDDTKKGLKSRVFTIRRRSIVQHGDEAEVYLGQSETPDYLIEGCFWRRCCKINNSAGEVVAQISRKKVSNLVELGNDVFNLVVQPGINLELMMAFVVIMDRICQKPFITTSMCY